MWAHAIKALTLETLGLQEQKAIEGQTFAFLWAEWLLFPKVRDFFTQLTAEYSILHISWD